MKKPPMTLPDAMKKGAGEGHLTIPGHAEGTFKPLPGLPVHPTGKATPLVAKIEATIDATPQPLRKLRPYTSMVLQIPPGLSSEAQIVLHNLFACFEKQGHVAEGLVGDLIWGFAQASPPIPAPCTIKGIDHLRQYGYLVLQAPDNSYVDFHSDKAERAWVRYLPKLLEKIYEGSK